MVEEGAPFCPNCRAPQIRVNVPVAEEASPAPDLPATPAFPPGTPGEIQPPATPVPLTTKLRLRDALGVACATSIVMVVFWRLVPAAFILDITGAGMLAVFLYSRRRPEVHLNVGAGARIGMLSGLVTYIFMFIVILFGYLADHGAKFREAIEQWAGTRPADDPARAQVMDWIASPDSMATLVVAMLIFLAVVLIGFSSLGGMIAARLVRKKTPRF
jgi:hypothetical protein